MENIIVEGNSSYSFGGGVFHHAGVTTISNAKITNNYALTQHGGGIAVFVGGTVLNNVEVSYNTAEYLGGGLAIYESEVDLLNTTFSNNIDHANNSAIWSSNSTASLVNSIVWDNQPNQLEGAYTITYSNIPDNTEIFGDGEGNINTDPLFVDPGNGDFTLSDGSPCIDTGTADIDGDGEDDLSVALTIEGIITQGDGWGVETSGGLIPIIEKLWINPTFQWEVTALDQTDPLWDSLQHLEISLMKGLAFDITLDDSESYAIVIDTRFTQPPHLSLIHI